MTDDLTAIARKGLELAEKATPGRWEFNAFSHPNLTHRGNIVAHCKGFPDRWVANAVGQETTGERIANAEFIAFARTALPALAQAQLLDQGAEIERLRAIEFAAHQLTDSLAFHNRNGCFEPVDSAWYALECTLSPPKKTRGPDRRTHTETLDGERLFFWPRHNGVAKNRRTNPDRRARREGGESSPAMDDGLPHMNRNE